MKPWFNHDAVEWVVLQSDVPKDQFATYLVVASDTDECGRGSRKPQATIAKLARRSVRSVRNDLHALVKDGSLLEGDWRLVVHIRPDKRPDVFDLPDKYRDSRPAAVAGRQHRATGKKRQSDRQKTSERPAAVADKEVLNKYGRRDENDAQSSTASTSQEKCPRCANPIDSAYHRNSCDAERKEPTP